MTNVAQIAAALVAALSAGSFSRPFAAERVYQLPSEAENAGLEHYDSLRVYVVPAGIATTLASRDSTEDEYIITVGILQRVGGEEELDALIAFTGEIADWLRFRHLDIGGQRVHWAGLENNPIFAPRALAERKQFVSVIAVTYRVHRGA